MFLHGDLRFSASEAYEKIVSRHSDAFIDHIVKMPSSRLEGGAYLVKVAHPLPAGFFFHQPGAYLVKIRSAAFGPQDLRKCITHVII